MASLKLFLTALASLFICVSETNAQNFQSPCPELFTYDQTTNETDRWYGTLTLLSESDLLDVFVRLTFDRPSLQLANWFGQVETSDSKEYQIRKNNHELKANVPQKFKFFLKYNPNLPAPRLISFRLNGKLVCSDDIDFQNTQSRDKLDNGQVNINSQNFGVNNNRDRYNPQLGTNSQDRTVNNANDRGNTQTGFRDKINNEVDINSRDRVNNQLDTNSGSKFNTNTQNILDINSRDRVTTPSSFNFRDQVNTQESINLFNRLNTETNTNNRDKFSPPTIINSQKFDANSQDRPNGFNGVVTSEPTTNFRVTTSPSFITQNINSYNRVVTTPSSQTRSDIPFSPQVSMNSRDKVNNNQDSSSSRDRFHPTALDTQTGSISSSYIPQLGSNPQDSFGNTTQNTINRDNICGTVLPKARPLIAYGEITHEGEFPWHSALYLAKHTSLTYICGASLISREYVVTTAHCLKRKSPQEEFKAEELIVQLGKYDLRRFGEGYQDRLVSKIISHPRFNAESYQNDIALLKLASPANITEYVRPVCLWQDSTDISSVVNKIGLVVGWGFDETGKVTEELMQAKMPVIPRDKCISSYPSFYSRFASANSYCAGFANGTSPCNGDAGGGMVFPIPNSNRRNPVWHLRGMVSILPTFQNQLLCDVTHYTIFTDVAKHLDWISASMT